MYQANIILSIECILYSNGFHNSQRVFIIHPNDENLFDWKKAKKKCQTTVFCLFRMDFTIRVETIVIRFFIFHPDENLFERKQILFCPSNEFSRFRMNFIIRNVENIVIRFFIIYLNNKNLFDWKKAKERYDLPSECILLFSNGFHNSQHVFIIHPNLFERK